MFHWVVGVPFGLNQNEYEGLTLWEQVDNGAHFTPTKKFLTAVPIVLYVAFECFSAYSTVGLTLNFTPTLTEPSKYVLIGCMFIGRIGMLNLMVGLLRRMNHQFYEYPKENILIN